MRSPSIVASALALLIGAPALASEKSLDCSVGKFKATTKAMRCLIRDERDVLGGSAPQPERCEEKLRASFERLESGGECPTAEDYGDAYAYLLAAEQPLVPALLDIADASSDPAACVSQQLVAASIYVSCRSKKRMSGLQRRDMSSYGEDLVGSCSHKLDLRLARIAQESDLGCPSYFDSQWPIAESVQLSRSYLPGVDLSSGRVSVDDFHLGFLPAADFSNARLYGVSFVDADLTNATFSGAEFRNSVFSGSNLAGAIFSGADLNSVRGVAVASCPAMLPDDWKCIKNNLVGPTADLEEADLSGADLHDLDLSEASFHVANLSGANLSGADLSGAWIGYSDLTGANLAGAKMIGTGLSGANLDGADLTAAELSGYTYGTYVNWSTFSARNLAGCPSLSSPWTCLANALVGPLSKMDGLDLSGTDLSGRTFYRSSFVGTDLNGTDFDNSDLDQADLTGADLTGASLEQARLIYTVWSSTTCPDGALSNSVGGNCCGHHVGAPPLYCVP